MESKLNDLQEEVDSLKTARKEDQRTIQTPKNQINFLKTNSISSSKPQFQDEVVSFSAYVSTGYVNYDTSTTIVFDKEVSDIGGYYNHQVGVFTCPLAGMYLFHVSVHTGTSSTSYRVEAEIQVAGEGLVDVAVIGYGNAANSVVTFCDATNQVSVRSLYSQSRIHGTDDRRYSSFSGTLLFTTAQPVQQ